MGQINATITDQPVGMIPMRDPLLKGVYSTGFTDAPGVVAANNFITLVNPVANTKTIVILGVFISCYIASGSSNARASMTGNAATAVSGGTLTAASAVAKFRSSDPAPTAEVRTGNPTATAGNVIFNSPPPITTNGQYVHSVGYGAATSTGAYTILPGEGIVIKTASGNTSQTWNVSIVWGEV